MATDPAPLSGRSKRFRSQAEFCAWNFPKAHRLKTCGCYPKPPERILVILPRPGV